MYLCFKILMYLYTHTNMLPPSYPLGRIKKGTSIIKGKIITTLTILVVSVPALARKPPIMQFCTVLKRIGREIGRS